MRTYFSVKTFLNLEVWVNYLENLISIVLATSCEDRNISNFVELSEE